MKRTPTKEEKEIILDAVFAPLEAEAPLAPAHGSATGEGFARTPEVLQYDGPQMEDYPDWDSWYFARQMWFGKIMLERSRKAQNGRAERAEGRPQ